MAYENLPGIEQTRLDGNLMIAEVATDPVTVILGTAAQGYSELLYPVRRLNDAARVYGKTGTLVRGMYEAAAGGAKNIRLFRIGATAAKLEDVGGGITIETIEKDDSIGTAYSLFWDHSAGRLKIWRVSDDTLVYDNYPSYPLQAIDLGEVAVSGSKAVGGTWTDIGTSDVPVTLAAADGTGGGTGAVYTAGTDGLNLSRMEMYEVLYNAYQLLEDQRVDIVIPMNVYLDDKNVMDMAAAEISTLALTSLSDYPSAGSSTDVLGKFYVEEYEGQNYFWWWFPSDPTSEVFAAANIYPSVGSASATKKADGTSLTEADFHEVNFAYQLAQFCYEHSTYVIDVTGNIGTLPPVSYAPRDISRWVGKLPVYELDLTTNKNLITTNGSGLLGNKFLSGRKQASGVTGFAIDGVSGLFGGGFIATDTGFLDGTQQKDDNDALVDIGQYISIVPAYVILSNASRTTSYVSNGAATYAGFYSALPANESPMNLVVDMVRLPYRINPTKINLLAGAKCVMFHPKPKGIVVADAPTAARAESDFRRLTTVRIAKAVIDALRDVADPFLGKPLSELRQQALDGALGDELSNKVKEEFLSRYEKTLQVTPAGRIQGHAVLELVLVPVFEMRKLFIVVSLAPV